MLFDVFGRRLIVERSAGRWQAFYGGPDGKRREARDLVIPAEVAEAELERYLADLCHEWASPQAPHVRRLA